MPSHEVFWGQIGSYNSTFEYLHYLWIAVSLALLSWVFVKPGKTATYVWKAFLSATFIFTGIAFFEVFTASPVSRIFYGPLFLLVGVFLYRDLVSNKSVIRFPEEKWARCVLLGGLALVYAYPSFGMALGRRFPYLCMPMDPCPLTVLAIIMATTATSNVNRRVLVSLIPWGLLGLPKAMGMYGCYEDAILFAAGLYGLVIVIANRSRAGKSSLVRVR